MKIGRINSTTKGKDEATSKKIESAEMQFGREMDHGHCVGREPWLWRRARERLTHRREHRKK